MAKPPLAGTRELTTRAGSTLLLVVLVSTIFVVPVCPEDWHTLLYRGFYTVIFVMCTLSVDRHRKVFLAGAVILTVLEWIAERLGDAVSSLSDVLNIGFFVMMVLTLILQIAGKKRVDRRVVLGSINAYLLLGLALSAVVAMIDRHDPGAFNFPATAEHVSTHSKYVYYAFITMTTVGYGDVVPTVPYARSLAILAGVAGQMYVAIVIALLVGKFASSSD